MIGVRRFLSGGTRSQSPTTASPTTPEPVPGLPPTAPLVVSTGSKSTWPPSPLLRSSTGSTSRVDNESTSTLGGASGSHSNGFHAANGSRSSSFESDSRPTSAASSVASSSRKPIPPLPSSSASPPRFNGVIPGPSSPSRPLPNRVAQLSQKLSDRNWKRSSSMVDTRDELLMSLLASEAVVDSREFEILSSEEVEELKKESQIHEVRLAAMTKKLQLETKIRDAAASLAKVNAAHKSVSKQSSEQLDAANRKVETVQKELWRISERSNDINKKLMEHRAGVLSLSLRNLEAKFAGDTDESGYSSSFRSSQMSPTTSETSYTSSRAKFEGAHLFAGHENAIQPLSPRKLPSVAEFQQLEEKIKSVSAQLQAAIASRNEADRDLAHIRLEKDQVETSLGLEIQSLEERHELMEREMGRISVLETQLHELAAERDALIRDRETKGREFDTLVRRLEVLEEKSSEALGVEMRVLELESALGTLQSLLRSHGVDVPSDASVSQYIDLLSDYLDSVKSRVSDQAQQGDEWDSFRQQLELDLQSITIKKEGLQSELELTRKQREDARQQIRQLEIRLQEQVMSPVGKPRPTPLFNGEIPTDVKKFIQILQPLWNALPSPETRASKFGQRTKSPVTTPGSPNMSLSELDVRLLKTLYDGRPAYQTVNNSGAFTIEEFSARVQALIADDRALIERLIRFAQAHDLLKKNAERAQKLAQDSSVALETYQKQVKILEERNMKLASDIATLQDEIQELQDAIDKVMEEKREVEMQAAEQAETCRQLSEANNALSAKTLTLAEEAATAPTAVRSQLEKQLADCKVELGRAKEDLDAMRSAEQSQNIALLDELNHMQGENENLRLQLRALQAGGKK